MKVIGAFQAKTHLSDLLEKVGRGESFLITKRGKPIASLSPLASAKHEGPQEVIARFRKKFDKSLKKFSTAEIKELKSLGRR
jgi:prevent-host-death family protein